MKRNSLNTGERHVFEYRHVGKEVRTWTRANSMSAYSIIMAHMVTCGVNLRWIKNLNHSTAFLPLKQKFLSLKAL